MAGCAPTVASLGAAIELAAVLPAPLPVQIARFLDAYNIGCRNIASLPRSRAAKMSVHCSDGTLTVPANCGAPTPQLHWRKLLDPFDVVLMAPNEFKHPRLLLNNIKRAISGARHVPVVGVRAHASWTQTELAASPSGMVWMFFRHSDGQTVARRMGGGKLNQRDEIIVRCLRSQSAAAKLVLQRGSHGAVLVNGLPCPYFVDTCPVDTRSEVNAGDTLLATAVLSSATGSDDRTSIRRAVAAATGVVAGLEFPKHLDELDIE